MVPDAALIDLNHSTYHTLFTHARRFFPEEAKIQAGERSLMLFAVYSVKSWVTFRWLKQPAPNAQRRQSMRYKE
jgi:hypothetical protein